MYEEEGTWFLDLKKRLPAADQTKLTFRYKEQFSRYVTPAGGDERLPSEERTHGNTRHVLDASDYARRSCLRKLRLLLIQESCLTVTSDS